MNDQPAIALAPTVPSDAATPAAENSGFDGPVVERSVLRDAAPPDPAAPPPRSIPHQTHAHGPHGLLPSIQSLLYIIIVALFIVTFSVQPFRIPSPSMEPTLLVGDFVLVDKQAGPGQTVPLAPAALHRGDVVVFHFPVDPSLHLVKRIIAVPGDRVRLRGGRVYINDVALSEPYAAYRASRPDSFRDNFPYTRSTDPDVNAHWWIEMQRLLDGSDLRIPSGSYFVLGDNRNNSEDSRYWGLVPAGAVVGKPLLVYLSLGDTGPAAQPGSGRRTAGDLLAHMARWQRTLHIVR